MAGTGALAAIAGGLVFLLILGALMWMVRAFNRIVRLRNQVDAAWAQIDVQLQRRSDLIPNLVETVRGYASHESATLTAVVAARAGVVASAGAEPAARAQAENELTRSLGRLFAVAEDYPDLKANQNFAALQAELATTENKIAYARQFYNTAVQTHNTAGQTFPTVLIAGLIRFTQRQFFETAEAERHPVQVRF